MARPIVDNGNHHGRPSATPIVGVDLSGLLVLERGQDARVGFTAATGDYGEKHDILC
jgi:hypothetical protein